MKTGIFEEFELGFVIGSSDDWYFLGIGRIENSEDIARSAKHFDLCKKYLYIIILTCFCLLNFNDVVVTIFRIYSY